MILITVSLGPLIKSQNVPKNATLEKGSLFHNTGIQ